MSAFGAGSYNGLAFGPGSQFAVAAVDGLDDLPDVQTSDTARPFDHGAWGGNDWSSVRSVILDLGLRGTDPDDLGLLVQQAQGAFAVGSTDLPLVVRDGAQTVYGRVRRRSIPYDAGVLARLGRCVVEIVCPDPRVYAPADVVVASLASLVQLGMGFNTGFNLGFGGAGQVGGVTSLTNTGNVDGRLDLTIAAGTASLPFPTIEQTGRGFLVINATLAPGDVVQIHTRDRTVLLNGTPRADLVRLDSTWPNLPVGGATYRFTAGTSGTDATATFTGRAARL